MSDLHTHEQRVAEVLGRWSVQDLVEQTPEAMKAASEKYSAAQEKLMVIDQGVASVIHWWKILSGVKAYEVRRFKNFIYCSCESFYFRQRICKHAALTIGIRCWQCFLLSAQGGRLCTECESKAKTLVLPATQPFSMSTIF